MKVLITSAGRRVSLTRFFQAELTKVVSDGQVLTSDMQPHLSPACQVADGYFQVPRISDPAYLDAVISICCDNEIALLIPTIDTELLLLAENRLRFEAVGTKVSVPDAEFVRICRDKRLTDEFFRGKGIRAPRLIDKSAPTFPLFIKPYDGSLSVDTFAIPSADKITDYHLENEKLIFMEYLDPASHDEFTVDMYYDGSHQLICAVPRQRLAVRAGEVSKGLTSKNSLLQILREKLGYVHGARGCLTAQFFHNRETGEWTGIEINPRFGGGYPLSYHAGANYPRWLIEECLGASPPKYWDEWSDNLLMLRYDDEIIVHATTDF